MLEGDLGEAESNVRVVSDAPHIFDTIDVVDDFSHGEIPSVVHDVGEFDLGDWNMP